MDISTRVLMIMGVVLGGYAVVLLIMTLIFKLRGVSTKKLWVRYLAWFIIIPPLLIPLIYSRIIFQVVILVLSLLNFHEYSNVVGLWKDKYFSILCNAIIMLLYIPVFFQRFGLFQVVPIYMIIFVLLIPIMKGEYEHMLQKSCLAMFGLIYFGWFLAHIAYMRNVSNGIAYVFLLFLLVESNDAGSYIVGKIFGKHKLSPNISPGKTNEGFIGGILFVIILSFLLKNLAPEFSNVHRFLFAVLIAIAGTCGDLIISFIKRDLKIKDFGHVIPGHGGILDRFDSVIFAAPLFFHFVNLFYKIL